MKLWISVFVVLVLSEKENNFEVLYKRGVQAYLENNWKECVDLLESSLSLYKSYLSIQVFCKSRCHSLIQDELERADKRDFFAFYVLITRNAYCLMKCEKSYYHNRVSFTKETEKDFQNKVPYDYLQLCYFKIDEPEKAASCAYTFLICNPGHDVMQNNLRYYVGLPGVDVEKVKNLEPKDYQEIYMKGVHAYTEQAFENVIMWMEQALTEYLKAEEECRLFCEGPMSSVAEADFIILVAHQFTFTLRCKIDCPSKLSVVLGQKHPNFFPSHYHYLQFAYFKNKQLQKACEAVESYLLFHPNDTVMLDNKNFYSKLAEIQSSWFSPREEAIKYYSQFKQEKELLLFIEHAFQFNGDVDQDFTFLSKPLPPSSPTNSKLSEEINIQGMKRNINNPEEVVQWERSNGVNIIMKDKDLNGSLRFVADGLASQEECEKMISIAGEGALHGDGYNGKQSPHTEFEKFEGLTVVRAAILSQKGLLDASSSQIFLNVSEKARSYVEMYFKLESYLYFAYTHLVCRTALPDSPGLRTDLSHPVHADNCVLTNDGQCLKQRPAYTWRDYSAIVYLNEDFEGGDFIFAKDKNTVQASVRPKCGRMVAFSAGKENLHGVQAVKKGRRCALAMWYTLDPKHKERERDFAEHVLTDVIRRQEKKNNDEKVPKKNKSNISTVIPNDKSNLPVRSEDHLSVTKAHLHPEL